MRDQSKRQKRSNLNYFQEPIIWLTCQPEASQETNFKNKVEKWKAKLKETAQKEVANKISQKEEEQQQDNLDSDLERVSNKDSQTEEPEEDDDNNLLG